MLSSPINIGTQITTLASDSSSPELVNIGDVVVSLGDYFFSKSCKEIAKRYFKRKMVEETSIKEIPNQMIVWNIAS